MAGIYSSVKQYLSNKFGELTDVMYVTEDGQRVLGVQGSLQILDENGNPIGAGNPLHVDAVLEDSEVQGRKDEGTVADVKPVVAGYKDEDGNIKVPTLTNDGYFVYALSARKEPVEWGDETNIPQGTMYFPSVDGEFSQEGNIILYAKLVAGIDNTVTLNIENMEDLSTITPPILITDITDVCMVAGMDKDITTLSLQESYANASTNTSEYKVESGEMLVLMIVIPDFAYTRVRAKVSATNLGTASNIVHIVKQSKPIGR